MLNVTAGDVEFWQPLGAFGVAFVIFVYCVYRVLEGLGDRQAVSYEIDRPKVDRFVSTSIQLSHEEHRRRELQAATGKGGR